MEEDDQTTTAPTRRASLKYGGALGAGGLLAGCVGEGKTDDDGPADDGNDSATGEGDQTVAEEQGAVDEDGWDGEPYTVSMSPMGEVTFKEPPETVFTRLTHHADMAWALGRGDTINATHAPDYYDGLWNQFVERLPGVTLDWTGLYSSWKPSKEKLYELDSDVHLADPAWVAKQEAWDEDDIEEIGENVAPWFGNSLSDRHVEPPEGLKQGYEYYTLWEQFEIVAEAFRERERYEALAAVHDDMRAKIEEGLPPEEARPSAVMLASADLDEIYAYTVDDPGFLTAHTRPFGVKDAFEGDIETNTVVDFETLLEADPDVILFLGGFEPGTSLPKRRTAFREDPVASEITAVQENRMYPQGARYQGPILHLFQLEMTAKQLYPEKFGDWPEYDEGPYPEIPEEEQMFDRQRVAEIVNGEV